MIRKISSIFENFVNPFVSYEPNYASGSLPRFIWSCTYGFRKYLALITIFTGLMGTVEALIFIFLGKLVNNLSTDSPESILSLNNTPLLALSALLLLSPFVIAALTLLKFQAIKGNFSMRLRWFFHRHLLKQSVSFFHDEYSGGVATKLMQTALAIRDIVIAFLDIFVYVLIYFISSAFVLFTFHWLLLCPFVVWFVSFIFLSSYFLPRLTKVAKDKANARSETTGCIADAYTNITTVKLFAHADHELDFTKKSMKSLMEPVKVQQRLVSGFDLSTYIMSMLLVFSITMLSIWLWSEQRVEIGVVAAATALSLRFNSISSWAMWVVADLFEHFGTAKDGMQLLSLPIKIQDPEKPIKLKVNGGSISFKEVNFSYVKGAQVLKKFSLDISAGERVGVVGRSGVGKSTLINLLTRFYEIDSGEITIDGTKISDVSQDSLRDQIGLVTQDSSLFHRSIYDNIAYGKLCSSFNCIVDAAIKSEADKFIDSLTDSKERSGYDTLVGERGAKLSGGQRQRISLARVILKDAPILLLDEATSALDSEVENAIQSNLTKLMEGKTVLAIAHRLSTIAAMDRLIVLDEGKVLEEGTHEELLRKGGLYAQLWNHQSGGFLGEDSLPITKTA